MACNIIWCLGIKYLCMDEGQINRLDGEIGVIMQIIGFLWIK